MRTLSKTLVEKELKQLMKDFDKARPELVKTIAINSAILEKIPVYRDMQAIAIASGLDHPEDRTTTPIEMGFELGLRVAEKMKR